MTTVLLGSGVSFAHTQLDSLARIASVLRVLFCLGRIFPVVHGLCLCALFYLVASPGHMLVLLPRAYSLCDWMGLHDSRGDVSLCVFVCMRSGMVASAAASAPAFAPVSVSDDSIEWARLGVEWDSERVRGAVMRRCIH